MTSKTEEINASSITSTSLDAQICGVLIDISPMKKGKGAPNFHGEIVDEKKSANLWL